MVDGTSYLTFHLNGYDAESTDERSNRCFTATAVPTMKFTPGERSVNESMSDENGRRTRSFRAALKAVIRDNRHAIPLLIVLCIVLLALSVLSLLFIDRDSPSFVLLQINFAMIGAFLALLLGLHYRYGM